MNTSTTQDMHKKIKDEVLSCMSKSLILIVDDNPVNRNVMESICKSLGYVTLTAVDGFDAFDKLKNLPHLILLDIEMPGMDGKEFLRKFKNSKEGKEVPVLMVTSVDEVESMIECFKDGADDYITKPFEPEVLKARIENSLSKYLLHKIEKDLLDKTFSGTIKILSDVLSTLSPTLFGRTNRIRRIARLLCDELSYSNPWEVEMASLFSLLGCITLPEEILDKISQGKILLPEEKLLYEKHPISGFRLISQIPRLENVAQIILFQNIVTFTQFNILPSELLRKFTSVPQGAKILHAAIHYESAQAKAKNRMDLMNLLNPIDYEKEIYTAMERVMFIENGKIMKQISVKELEIGMIFADEVFSLSGNRVASKWMEVSYSIQERLLQIHERVSIKEPIPVYTLKK